MTTTTTTTPRIWIGCLAAYNNAKLHGEWVDAAVEEDELWEAQKRVIATSPERFAEEHFIADHEGFAPYRVGEYDSLSKVAQVARLIEKHGEAVAHWLSNNPSVLDDDDDDDDLGELFREAYQGEWDSEKAFARHNVAELGLPMVGYVFAQKRGAFGEPAYEEWGETLDRLDSYLDWETIGRDILQDYWTGEADGGGVYVFAY